MKELKHYTAKEVLRDFTIKKNIDAEIIDLKGRDVSFFDDIVVCKDITPKSRDAMSLANLIFFSFFRHKDEWFYVRMESPFFRYNMMHRHEIRDFNCNVVVYRYSNEAVMVNYEDICYDEFVNRKEDNSLKEDLDILISNLRLFLFFFLGESINEKVI